MTDHAHDYGAVIPFFALHAHSSTMKPALVQHSHASALLAEGSPVVRA